MEKMPKHQLQADRQSGGSWRLVRRKPTHDQRKEGNPEEKEQIQEILHPDGVTYALHKAHHQDEDKRKEG
jgi:hypothetical protein